MKHFAMLLGAVSLTAFAYAATQPTAQGAQPTKYHRMLTADVGEWIGDCELYIPGMPEPMHFDATESVSMIGDLWAVSDFKATMMGQPFHGRHQMGYDPEQKKFVATWIDSMNASITMMDLEADEESGTMESWHTTHQMGMEQKIHGIHNRIDESTRELLHYVVNDDGSETLSMKVTYKRK